MKDSVEMTEIIGEISLKEQEQIGSHPELLEPYGNYISIRLKKVETETLGGIALPDEVASRDRQVLARVVRVGPGQRSITTGELMPCQSKPGDLVIIMKHAPIELKLAGKSFHMLAEGDILGRIDESFLAVLMAEQEKLAAAAAALKVADQPAGTTLDTETEDGTVLARPSGLFVVQGKEKADA